MPVETAGCYVPGGLYGYTVAAIMTAGVAKAAGVTNIICTAPTNKSTGKIHPYTLYAMKKAGATKILALGGVQVQGCNENSLKISWESPGGCKIEAFLIL